MASSVSFFKVSAIALSTAFALAATTTPAEARPKHHHATPAAKAPAEKGKGKTQGKTTSLKASASINAETGEIIECNNCHESRAPASTTKLMTAMIAFDAIRSGKLKVEQKLPLAEATSVGEDGAVTLQKGNKKYRPIPVGTMLTVNQLMSAIAVSSAADATITVSKAICGTDNCIADLMNQKLNVIFKDNPHGLHTHFANPHGMPDKDQYTTAYDQAVIAAYMAKNYLPMATYYFSQTSYQADGIHYTGHNDLLTSACGWPYKCMEFGKTGFFRRPGPNEGLPAYFCITGTAARDGHRIAASTLGYTSGQARFSEEKRLFEEGFGAVANTPRTVKTPRTYVPEHFMDPVDPEDEGDNKVGYTLPSEQVRLTRFALN